MAYLERFTLCCLVIMTFGATCFGESHEKYNFMDKTDMIYGDGLCPDFQAIRDLIPRGVFNEIILLHSKCDRRFRIAMRFLHSEAFTKTASQIQRSVSYEALLAGLTGAGVNVTDIETIKGIFNCLLVALPIIEANEQVDCANWHKTALIDDIVNAMPREKVYDYIEESLMMVTNFSEFYRIIRSPDFLRNMQRNLNSRQLIRPMRLLRRNGIDLPKLLKSVMTIIYWGPIDY